MQLTQPLKTIPPMEGPLIFFNSDGRAHQGSVILSLVSTFRFGCFWDLLLDVHVSASFSETRALLLFQPPALPAKCSRSVTVQ